MDLPLTVAMDSARAGTLMVAARQGGDVVHFH
jgi:hypothetical protein